MPQPLLQGEAGPAGWVCALAGAALPRRVPLVAVGVVEAKNSALKLAGVTGLWGRSCLRWRAREPRELPPLRLPRPSRTRRCTWRGRFSVECLVIESASTRAPDFRIAARVLCMISQLE